MKAIPQRTKRATGLKLLTHYLNLQPTQGLDFKIEDTIGKLGELITVEKAEVTVQRSSNGYPPVRVKIAIVTPGPDIAVEARDYTGTAAYNKAWQELHRRARAKAERAERPRHHGPRLNRSPRKCAGT